MLLQQYRCVNNAAPTFPANFKRALEEFDVNEDGLIDYSEFLEIDRRYPLILFPAFRLQDVMQRSSLGKLQLKNEGSLDQLLICTSFLL